MWEKLITFILTHYIRGIPVYKTGRSLPSALRWKKRTLVGWLTLVAMGPLCHFVIFHK